MTLDFFAFSLRVDPLTIAGVGLWALVLYFTFAGFRQKVADGLMQWFNFAERSLYLSAEEFEKTRPARESQNAFWASILGVFPFLILGGFGYYGITLSLGQSWAISFGIMGTLIGGIYELARRNQI